VAQGKCRSREIHANFKQAIITAHTEQLNWKQQLYRFLRNYRATPHASTDKTPAELLFGRKMRIKLPEVSPTVIDCDLRCKDATAKRKMKEYADDETMRNQLHFRLEMMCQYDSESVTNSRRTTIPYHTT
jgi:predicted kinase